MAMPPPMVPAPTTAAELIGMGRCFFWNIRNLGHFTLAEEHMDESLRLIGVETIDEQLGFDLAAFLER